MNQASLVSPRSFPPYPIPWTRLPLFFDPAALRGDLSAIRDEDWKLHFNSADFNGAWSGVALRSTSGRIDDITPLGSVADFRDTPLLARCPSLRAAVEAFHFPLKSVRLLRLHPGSQVREHCDRDLGLADRELRIHIPIITSESVEFIVANRRLALREGESWYIDFSQPHRIDNSGPEHRIHLILDGELNSWAEDLLLRATREIVTETFEPEGVAQLEHFRRLVLQNTDLQSSLVDIMDSSAMLRAVVVAGEQHGFRFRLADAESLFNRNRREWTMRSIMQ